MLYGGISRVLCVPYVSLRRAEIYYWHVPNLCFVSVGSVPSTVFGCFWTFLKDRVSEDRRSRYEREEASEGEAGTRK